MKRIFLLAACASMAACTGHMASTQISELDEVRAMIQQAKDAGAEKCAPALQAKAVAGLYHAAHEITDEGDLNPADETADVISTALSNAKKSYAAAKKGCAKPVGHTFAKVEGVFFKTDSAELLPKSKMILDKALIEFKNRSVVDVEVAAHTDSRGAASHNLALSNRRAASVVDYLVSKGVKSSRLIPRGYGESQPRSDNGTVEGRAQNRRVELNVKMAQ